MVNAGCTLDISHDTSYSDIRQGIDAFAYMKNCSWGNNTWLSQ